jgi:anti-sigma factor (TIGR02949 family)
MDCDEVLDEIEHYLHGELDPDRSRHLAEHLAACSPCFDRAEFERKLKDIVRTKCHSNAPEHLVVKVRMALRSERGAFRGPPNQIL